MTSRREMLFRLSQAAVGIAVPPLGQGLVSGPCPRIQEVPDFVSMCFKDSKGTSHQVYVTGSTGPAVLLLHELPGLTARTFTTALELSKAGYIVVVPLLFGKTFDDRAFRNIWSICGRADFDCNGGERTSPQVAWLRELTAAARKTWPDGKGVGAIGMCLTGIISISGTTPVNGTPAFPVLSKTSADEVTVAQCHGRQGSDHGPASTSHLQKKGPLCFSG